MTPIERIEAAGAPESLHSLPARDDVACVGVSPADARALFETLHADCGFETVTLITAIDRGGAERFEVVWMLRSHGHGDRLRVTTRVGESDPTVPSITDLWPGAAFMERECYDMFGVLFEGNPDLRRLLMPEEYRHHPLRKDFPHHGIEPDRLYREWERSRR